MAFGLGEALGDFLVFRDLTLFLALGLFFALGDAFGEDLDTTRKVLLWPAAVARTPVSIPRNRTSRGKVEVRDSGGKGRGTDEKAKRGEIQKNLKNQVSWLSSSLCVNCCTSSAHGCPLVRFKLRSGRGRQWCKSCAASA